MESQIHINLVKVAYNYLSTLIPETNVRFIKMDSSGNCSGIHIIDNFVPDLYYAFDGFLVIGEAKTESDFEKRHSKDQFDAYIKQCNLHEGRALLIISVPWQLLITAKNYFRRKKMQNKIDFEIVVLDEQGRCFKI